MLFINLLFIPLFCRHIQLRSDSTLNKSVQHNFNHAIPANKLEEGEGQLPNFGKETDTKIIANRGKTASFMLAWPSITTFTLVKGWDEDSTVEMKRAVEQVLLRNPILMGRAKIDLSPLSKFEISIIPGPQNPSSYISEIDFQQKNIDYGDAKMPDNMNLCDMDSVEVLKFMDTFLAPIVPKSKSVFSLAKNKEPLFGITIIQLQNNYACYVVSMSHCVGDGVTYYNCMKEIDDAINNRSENRNTRLVWSDDEISSHEIFPARFSTRDREVAYGGPFFLGLLRNSLSMQLQTKSYIILEKELVEQKRIMLSKGQKSHLSHNDIITSALCQANLSSDLFAFTMNMRKKKNHYGGNFHNEVPFSKRHVEDPFAFRSIVRKGYFYETNHLPTCPFILGKAGRISSLASIQKLIKTGSMDIICHSMLSSFVQNVPLDTAFIISMNQDKYVILHNFRQIDLECDSLQDLLSHPP